MYLMITEDGEVKQIAEDLDNDQLEAVAGGGVRVFRCEEGLFSEMLVEAEEVSDDEYEDEEEEDFEPETHTEYTWSWVSV